MTADDPADQCQVVVSWSGGKDSAVMLADLLAREDVEIVELLTTVQADTGRSSMHGVRRELMAAQADALGLPLRLVELPRAPSNDEYEDVMAEVMAEYEAQGIDRVAFADLFLEEVREYREDRLADSSVDAWFPLWGRDTTELSRQFIEDGFQATVVCVNDEWFDDAAPGRRFDDAFLAALPGDVDPCGEHGEFHTFVHGGPIFDEPVAFELGDRVTKEPDHGVAVLHYVDLLPAA